MSTISISDLSTMGIALFDDTESYLKELTETSQIHGGFDADGKVGTAIRPSNGKSGALCSCCCLSQPPEIYPITAPVKTNS